MRSPSVLELAASAVIVAALTLAVIAAVGIAVAKYIDNKETKS